MRANLRYKLLCVLLAIALACFGVSCKDESETVIIQCNGMSVTEGTFLLLMTEQATSLLWEEGITEDNVVEKAKEAAMAYLPTYTYYKQGYQNAHYTLSEEDRGTLQANALAALLNSGMHYDPGKRDEVFQKYFGVNFDQYMAYQEETYLINYYYNTEIEKIEVDESMMEAYFHANQADYAVCTADIIRIAKADNDQALAIAKEVREALTAGTSLEECKTRFGGVLDKTETLTFDISSNLDTAFGDGFTAAMVASDPGDVFLLETEQYVSLGRTNGIAGYTENLDNIENQVKVEIYAAQVEEILKTDAYQPEIVDQARYDAITEIPGAAALQEQEEEEAAA